MSKTSISFAGLKADRPGLGDIYEDKLEYKKESGDRPWLEGLLPTPRGLGADSPAGWVPRFGYASIGV